MKDLKNTSTESKVKVGVLRPVQQPGSYWNRSSELPLVGLEPTEVTASTESGILGNSKFQQKNICGDLVSIYLNGNSSSGLHL